MTRGAAFHGKKLRFTFRAGSGSEPGVPDHNLVEHVYEGNKWLRVHGWHSCCGIKINLTQPTMPLKEIEYAVYGDLLVISGTSLFCLLKGDEDYSS